MVLGEEYQSDAVRGKTSSHIGGLRKPGDVPATVMMEECSGTQGCKPLQLQRGSSVSTCATSCSSSSTTSSLSSRRSSSSSKKSKSKKSLNKDIIAHLREELAQVKAKAEMELFKARSEAESNLALVHKLLEENQKIRKEANEAHARADRLEEEVAKLSSTKNGWTWHGVSQAIRDLRGEVEKKETMVEEKDTIAEEKESIVEEKEKSNDEVDFSLSDSLTLLDIESPRCESNKNVPSRKKSTCPRNNKLEKSKSKPMVTIQVPVKEGESDDNNTTFSKGFLNILQRAGSTRNAEENSPDLVCKQVTAEALLWESYAWNSSADLGFDTNALTSNQRIGASFSAGAGGKTMARKTSGFDEFSRTTHHNTCNSITE
mmetsp:Transcript_13501/g.18527  ORF Transcript_13501/g.18527 Transcript_13501/m.18527 type:complete len:374 (-) Transcript_13501:33-1154(-)